MSEPITAIDLPDGMIVAVAPAPRGSDGFCVVLDIEETTFHLHPADAGRIGAALIVAAKDAAQKSG